VSEGEGECNRPCLTKELRTLKGDETLGGEKPEANPNDEPRGEAKGPGTEAFPHPKVRRPLEEPRTPAPRIAPRIQPVPNYRR